MRVCESVMSCIEMSHVTKLRCRVTYTGSRKAARLRNFAGGCVTVSVTHTQKRKVLLKLQKTLFALKRDLYIVKRDQYTLEKDLYTLKSDLFSL